MSTEYVSIKHDMEFICPVCKKHYFRSFDNIKTRKKIICNECSLNERAKSQAFTHLQVKEYIETTSNSGCKLLSDSYINTDSKLDIQCKCGNNFKTSFYKFKNRDKRQCNKCGINNTRLKNATPLNKIIDLVEKASYEFIDNKLDGQDQKVLIRCDKQHNPYWVTVSKFKSGRRCPYCSRSLGEEFIYKELTNFKIDFKQEYSFKELIGIGGGLLRFDFALFSNNCLVALIEFDGAQHYELSFDSPEAFERTKIHDKLKNDYANKNNIPLFRIPYFEYARIPEIINNIVMNLYKNIA